MGGWAFGFAWLAAVLALGAAEARFTHRAWNRDDGLPDNAAERLLVTRDGWLWIGTRSGLARFDGLKFTVYDGRTPGFTDDAILDLAEDVAGSLWIATKRGLYRKHGGRFTKFTTADGLLHNQVNHVLPAPDNGLWLATIGGVNWFTPGASRKFADPGPDSLPTKAPEVLHDVICLGWAEQGGLWLGTQDGLHHLDPDTATRRLVWRPGLPTELPHAHDIQRLWIANDGRLWLAGEHAVFHRTSDGWETLPLPPGAGDLRCRRLTGDAAGNLWAVRGGQLFRVATNGVRPWSGPATLPDAYVTDVLPDAGGGLWVTTRYAGLHRLTPAGLGLLTTQDGLPHNSVTSVTPERGGGVWVGTLRGVARWRDGRFVTPAAELPLPEVGARAVFEERSGDLWIGRSTELGPQLAWLEPQTNGYRSLGLESGIRAPGWFAEDQSGRLWMGGAVGLACLLTNYLPQLFPQGGQLGVHVHRKRSSRWQIMPTETSHIAGLYWDMFEPDRWRPGPKDDVPWQPLASVPAERIRDAPFPVDFRPANLQFRAFAETRDGAIWLGTWGGGLYRLRGGKVTDLTTRDGLPSDHVHCLHEDGDGQLWIGTARGLARFPPHGSQAHEVRTDSAFRTPHSAFAFTSAHGLPNDDIRQILEDAGGNFWIGCGRGIFRVARSALDAVATGKTGQVECLLFDEEDGLTAGESATGAQPAACQTADGHLWFATPQGLARIDPATAIARRPAPRVVLETLRTTDRAYPLLDAIVGQVQLPPGSGHSLAVEFTALEHSAPRRLRFRYRLAGHEAGWIEAGPRRTAFYTNLKPRNYRFEVQAASRDGRWTEPGEVLAFTIAPFLRETTAFKSALGLLIAFVATGSGWGVYRWRRGYLERVHELEQEQAVATERKRIARDLHDQIGSELTRLSFASEASAAGGGEVPGLARDAVRSLEEVVWATDPTKDDVQHLADFLSRHAREYLAGQPIRLRLDVPVDLPDVPLSARARHHLALAFKEALHNVVKHAAATEVCLKVRLQPAAGKADFPVRPRTPQTRAVPSSSSESTRRRGESAFPKFYELVVELADNGVGFEVTRLPQTGNGLTNLRSRLQEAGGRCEFLRAPGSGTLVRFTLPLA